MYNVKKKENEDVQEFNIRFNKTLEKILDDVKPPEKTITLHFMDAFDATFSFMLKEKKPTSLKQTMDKAHEMEKHVPSTGKTNLLGSSSSYHSSHTCREDKSLGSMNVDPSPDPMQTLISSMTQMMKQ